MTFLKLHQMRTQKFGNLPSDWKICTLGDCAQISGRIGWRGLKQEEYTEAGPFLVAGKHIKVGRISWGSCDHIHPARYEESPEIALEIGDVIFSKDGSLGNPALIDAMPGPATINSTMMLIRPLNQSLSSRFLFQILKSDYFENLIRERVSGSSIPHIFQRDMKDFHFPLPPIPEQERIASTLAALDDKLYLIERQIGSTQALKQGLMQTLFSRGVGTKDPNGRWVPHTQFKECELGEIPAAWLVTTLGGVCNGALQTGPFGSQLHAEEYQEEGIPVLMPKDLINCRARLSTAARIAPTRAEELSKHKLNIGDLLFSRRGDVARFALIDEDSVGALCGTGCLKAKPSEAHSSAFIAHLLQLDVIRTWLEQNAVGQTMPNLNTGILAALPLMAPANKQEQEEIATILDSVDTKVEVLLKKQAALQILKRGLMQKLLTGEWRLTLDEQHETAIAA